MYFITRLTTDLDTLNCFQTELWEGGLLVWHIKYQHLDPDKLEEDINLANSTKSIWKKTLRPKKVLQRGSTKEAQDPLTNYHHQDPEEHPGFQESGSRATQKKLKILLNIIMSIWKKIL